MSHDSEVNDLLEEQVESLFEALKHGDYLHQSWLKRAIRAWFRQEPVPPVEF